MSRGPTDTVLGQRQPAIMERAKVAQETKDVSVTVGSSPPLLESALMAEPSPLSAKA
jgi:hypothetical protein